MQKLADKHLSSKWVSASRSIILLQTFLPEDGNIVQKLAVKIRRAQGFMLVARLFPHHPFLVHLIDIIVDRGCVHGQIDAVLRAGHHTESGAFPAFSRVEQSGPGECGSGAFEAFEVVGKGYRLSGVAR